MSSAQNRPVSLIALLSVLLSLGVLLPAQNPEARIPIRVLGGRIVAHCRISSPRRTIPVNLFIAYDRACGLELHNKVTNPLGVEHEDGRFDPITLEFPGMDIEVARREHGDEDDMESFTRLYAPEMDEVACVGTIGAKILSKYVVTFDLPRGMIILRAPSENATGAAPEGPEAFYVPSSMAGDMVWFPVTIPGGETRMMSVGGHSYDSIIDEDFCDELDAPDGNVGPILLGPDLDLSGIVAWRPEEFDWVHPGGALATLGVGFLECFRVELDPVNDWVGFTRCIERGFPAVDREFFAARAEEETEPLLKWLERHGDTRLGREAAELLLTMQMDEGAALEDMKAAVDWVHRTRRKDLRATEALKTVAALRVARCEEAAIYAADKGIADGRSDRYPESVYRLHVAVGEIQLARHEDRAAWEHLLSAAFGLSDAVGAPDRAKVNLLLGEYYERIGKYRRALSRYVQAVVTPEAGPQAIAALEALQKKTGGEPFSVAYVEKLISGRVRGMTAPTRFEEDLETVKSNRVVLVEHLTNPHFGRKRGEQWLPLAEGGAMVFEALLTHFPRDRVALVSYHGDAPRPVATMNSLSLRAWEDAGNQPMFVVNGRPAADGVLPYFKADAVYDALKPMITRAIARPSKVEIDGRVHLEGARIRGEIRVRSQTGGSGRLEVILVEKAVLYPGLGGAVIHRMVARGALTAELEGVPLDLSDGPETVPLDVDLKSVVAENRAFLEAYEEGGGSSATRLSLAMDPKNLAVIAVLRAPGSRRVLQAAYFDVVFDSTEVR